MVEAPPAPRIVENIGEVVAFVRAGHPHSGLCTVVQHNLLSQTAAEVTLEEFPASLDVESETLHMLKSPDADATCREPLCLILQTWTQIGRSHIPFCFVVQLHF